MQLATTWTSGSGCSCEISMRILSSGWSGCFRWLAINVSPYSAGTKASGKGKRASRSKSRGRVRGNGKPDVSRLSPATSRQTSSGPIRGGIAYVPRSPLKSVHGAVSKDGSFCARLSKSRITRRTPCTSQAIIWQFRWYGARSVDDTDHQTWNISHNGERGWRDLFVGVTLSLMELFFSSQLFLQLVSSSQSSPVLRRCTTLGINIDSTSSACRSNPRSFTCTQDQSIFNAK